MRVLCVGIGSLFLSLWYAMALQTVDQNDSDRKDKVRERLERMEMSDNRIHEKEVQRTEREKWIRGNADIIIAIAQEEAEKLFKPAIVSTGYRGLLVSCLWWVIEADRERGLAFNLDLFKKIQLALLVIEPHFINKPKETRELLGKEGTGYVSGLMTLRSDIVYYFTEAKSALLIENVKPLIESEMGTMTTSLQYLVLFVDKDKSLKEFLVQKCRDSKSKAYNHPLLKNLDKKEE